MTNGNDERTVNEWLKAIYHENEAAHREIHSKLDQVVGHKTDKEDHDKLEERVSRVEKRTNHLEVKQAGISAGILSLGLWVRSFFG